MSFTTSLTEIDTKFYTKLLSGKLNLLNNNVKCEEIFREFKNKGIREFLQWFWKQSDYNNRIYILKYKYNHELKRQFMNINLVRGIKQRCKCNGMGIFYLLKETGKEVYEIHGLFISPDQKLGENDDWDLFDIETTTLIDKTRINEYFEGKFVGEMSVDFIDMILNQNWRENE